MWLVLRQFGFSIVFCDLIPVILHLACLSVLVNGKVVGYFSCASGVRQGDSWSPLLFCLVEEVLSRAISLVANSGTLLLCPIAGKFPSLLMFFMSTTFLFFALLPRKISAACFEFFVIIQSLWDKLLACRKANFTLEL